MSGVTAIMQNNCKRIILDSIDNTFHIDRRIALTIFIRKKSGSRFRHNNTGHSGLFDSQTITENEFRAFLQ